MALVSRVCKECRGEFEAPAGRTSHFCCARCEKVWRFKVERSRESGDLLCPATVGAIGELLVCADLLAKGYHVFKSVSAACPCDLVVMRGDLLLRVEVKQVKGAASTVRSVEMYRKTNAFDLLAVVTEDSRITYFGEHSELARL